ncbi:MAG: hypothetical protein WBL28_10770 [Methylotenera sp.]
MKKHVLNANSCLVHIFISISTMAFFLFSSLTVSAASFDCKRSVTKVEKMVFDKNGTLRLQELDERLLNSYRYALSLANNPVKLKKTQRTWIKKRNLCADEMCLKTIYQLRIDELSEIAKHDGEKVYQEKSLGQNKKESILNNHNLGFCKKIAELAAISELPYLIPTDNSKAFEAIYESYDIDQDGTNDKIIVDGGTRLSSMKVLLSSGKFYNSSKAHTTNLIEYESRVYLINFSPWEGDSNSISYFNGVDWLSREGIKTVCNYKEIQR